MILTTDEAAGELGVTTARVRQLVAAGALVPINPGARAYRFHLIDVAHLQAERRSDAERDMLDTLAERLAGMAG